MAELDGAHIRLLRATLNTVMLDQIVEALRSVYLGHTPAVNREQYVDSTDPTLIIAAFKRCEKLATLRRVQ